MKTRLPPGIFEIGSGIPPSHKYGVENGVNVPERELPEICPENESAPRQVSWSPKARTTIVTWKVSATLVPEALPVTVPVKVPTRPPKSIVFGARVPVTADPLVLRVMKAVPLSFQVPAKVVFVGVVGAAGVVGAVVVGVVGVVAVVVVLVEAVLVVLDGAVGDPPPPPHAARELAQIRTEAIRMRCIMEVWTDGR